MYLYRRSLNGEDPFKISESIELNFNFNVDEFDIEFIITDDQESGEILTKNLKNDNIEITYLIHFFG